MAQIDKRKQDMMKLWKDTFGDSDRYIKLVFDTYYSLENSFTKYEGERLIAALLAVPYEFQTTAKTRLRGLYLCGLATHPEWRKKGIMGSLMEETEESAKERGFDMTFLIPADEHLRSYYEKKGYENTSFRLSRLYEQPKEAEDHGKTKLHIYTIQDLIKQREKSNFLHQLIDWCRNIEISRNNSTIVHSREDLLTAMAENENSIFLTDYTFDPEYPILAKVVAVAFPEKSETLKDTIRIVELYTEEKESSGRHSGRENRQTYSKVITTILEHYRCSQVEIVEPYVGTGIDNRREGAKAIPYAMTKMIKTDGILNKNEVSRFEISLMLD